MTDPRKVAINDTQPEDFIYTSEESKNPANQVVVIYSSRIKGRGSVFVVTRMAAVLSKTVKDAMEDLGDGAVAIPLPKEGITSEAFSKCFFWMENARNRTTEEVKEDEDTVKLPELTDYDTEMCDTMSDALKTNCIIAANYLNCKPLLDILLVSVAALAKGQSPEELRKCLERTKKAIPDDLGKAVIVKASDDKGKETGDAMEAGSPSKRKR